MDSIATKVEIPGGVEAGGWIALIGALLVVGASNHIALDVVRRSAVETAAGPELRFRPPAIALILLLLYVALITHDAVRFTLPLRAAGAGPRSARPARQ